MHAAGTKSLRWGIVLLAVGALISAFGADLHMSIAGSLGIQAAGLVLRVMSTLAYVATPLGAALIGATVVIRVLSPARQAEERSHAE